MRNDLPPFTNSGPKRSSYEEMAKRLSGYWKSIKISMIISGFHVSDIVKIKELNAMMKMQITCCQKLNVSKK